MNDEAPAGPGIPGLDISKLGLILLTACMVSRQLGHRSVAGTVRDYLAPHGPYDAEREFVYDVIRGRNPQEMISDDELVQWLRNVQLPSSATIPP